MNGRLVQYNVTQAGTIVSSANLQVLLYNFVGYKKLDLAVDVFNTLVGSLPADHDYIFVVGIQVFCNLGQVACLYMQPNRRMRL